MTDLKPEDIIHKSYMNRILMEIADNGILLQCLAFKGGTCASMLSYLDRFSVDLDFDLIKNEKEAIIRKELKDIFRHLGLTVKKEFDNVLMFQILHPSQPNKRNSIKVSINTNPPKSNIYKVQNLPEINRLMSCQTIETMFANKLVAVTDRYEKHNTIAGRDIYDIHYFFINGHNCSDKVIKERTGLDRNEYFAKLSKFISEKISQTTINEDLNSLLPDKKFQSVRKVLIPETLNFLSSNV